MINTWYFAKFAAVIAFHTAPLTTVTAYPALCAANCSRLIGLPAPSVMTSIVVTESPLINAVLAVEVARAAGALNCTAATSPPRIMAAATTLEANRDRAPDRLTLRAPHSQSEFYSPKRSCPGPHDLSPV